MTGSVAWVDPAAAANANQRRRQPARHPRSVLRLAENAYARPHRDRFLASSDQRCGADADFSGRSRERPWGVDRVSDARRLSNISAADLSKPAACDSEFQRRSEERRVGKEYRARCCWDE